MGTGTRPELSPKNKYFVERNRYYELKHFCMQYPLWKRELSVLDGYRDRSRSEIIFSSGEPSDPTNTYAESREYYQDRIALVEKVAKDTDPVVGHYILKAITKGFSYDTASTHWRIPCSRDIYYELYRKFFWLLDKARG